VSATSSSGLTVAIALDASSSGCSLSGSTVTFTAAGTCVIDANQAGNGDYLPAGQMQQSFPISRLNQTINFTSTAPSAATFGDAPYTATATATSGLTVAFTSATPAVCTSTGTNGATITLVAAGSCTVSANQAGNGTYNPAPQVLQTFSIAKANQTISVTSTAPPGATVGGATYTASATATSGLTVTFSSATTSMCTSSGTNGATITFVGAGTCTVNTNQPGNANYNPAPTKPQTFSVGKGSQTITFTSTAPANAAAGGATYTVAATGGASTSPVTFSSATTSVCTVSGSTVTFGAAGTCTINANQVGDANYNAAAQKQQSFPVAAAAPTVSDVTMHNGAGNNTAGKVETGDTLSIQYSAQMKASTFCSTWTSTGDQTLNTNSQVTVTITDNGANDTLTVSTTGCTFNLGSVNLGADYVSATVTFIGTGSNKSIVSLNTGGLLTITLGTANLSTSLRPGVAASNPVYTPASGLTDAAGTALATTPFTDPDPSRF
jgi:hypothetical protein